MNEMEFRKSHKKTLGFIHKEANENLSSFFKKRNFIPPRITHKMVYYIFKVIKDNPELITGRIRTDNLTPEDCTNAAKPTCERCFGQQVIAGPDMKLYECPDCSGDNV